MRHSLLRTIPIILQLLLTLNPRTHKNPCPKRSRTDKLKQKKSHRDCPTLQTYVEIFSWTTLSFHRTLNVLRTTNIFETLRCYSHAPHAILENPPPPVVRVVLRVTACVVIVVVLVAIAGSGHVHARGQTLHDDAEIV